MKFENLMQAEFSIKLICQHEIRARKLAFLEEDKLHYFAVNHSLKIATKKYGKKSLHLKHIEQSIILVLLMKFDKCVTTGCVIQRN